MRKRLRYSEQERIDRASIICKLYSTNKYRITDCCKAVGVSYDTFKDWAQVWLSEEDIKLGNYRPGFIPAIYAMYKKAITGDSKVNFEALVLNRVRESLLLRAGIFYKEETSSKILINKKGRVLYTVITKTSKPVFPDTRALIYLCKAVSALTP